MKNKAIKRGNNTILILILLFLVLLPAVFLIKRKIAGSNNLSSTPTLDIHNSRRSDGAVSYYTMKWLENIKFGGKGILSRVNLQTTNEGKITRLSFNHGEINVDKETNVNYPFVVRMELYNDKNQNYETLYFSQVRYDKAKLYKTGQNGLTEKIGWSDVKVGDYAKVEEETDLLISNVDNQNKFTDSHVKNLTIYLQ